MSDEAMEKSVPAGIGEAPAEEGDGHCCEKWALRIVNAPLVAFGIAVLSVVGLMLKNETLDLSTLVPLIVLGACFLVIGVLGLLATKTPKLVKIYWLVLFFGTVVFSDYLI